MKKVGLMVLVTIFVVGIMDIGFKPIPCYAKSMLLKDLDNKIDPVSGEKIVKKRFNTGYKGYRIWFVSYSNLKKFKENPDKYADKLGIIDKANTGKDTDKLDTDKAKASKDTDKLGTDKQKRVRRRWWN